MSDIFLGVGVLGVLVGVAVAMGSSTLRCGIEVCNGRARVFSLLRLCDAPTQSTPASRVVDGSLVALQGM